MIVDERPKNEEEGCCINGKSCDLDWFCTNAPRDRQIDMLLWSNRFSWEELGKFQVGVLSQKFLLTEIEGILLLAAGYDKGLFR